MVSCPCINRGVSEAKSPHKTVNIFLGYFFMVNFCLGTGFLGVPYSFFYSGYLAAIPTLILCAFVTWLTSTWLLEVMARAQALESIKKRRSDSDIFENDIADNKSTRSSDSPASYHCADPVFEITHARKFEPVELSEIFVGKWFKYVYLAVVTIYSFLACWSFSTVAGTAWASNIPYNFGSLEICSESAFHHHVLPKGGCLSSYYFSVFLFGILMIFLSVLDLKEQAIVQVFLGSARFLTVGAIVIYTMAKLSHGGDACGEDEILTASNSSSNISELGNATRYTSYNNIVFKFDPKGWVAAIPVFTYAFIIHTGISSLSHPVKQKKYLHWMLAGMSVTALVSYMSLGLVVPLWFKAGVQETITLNWGGFTGPKNSLGLRVLSYYLIFFPSLDVMSAFPLTIHCIVNNIYIILTGRDTSEKPHWKCDWLFRFILRFVAALIPLLAAMGVANLIYILKYAGLFGFTIALFFPAVLQLRSIYVCNREFHRPESDAPHVTVIVNEKSSLIQTPEETPLGADTGMIALSGVLEFHKKSRSTYMTPYSRGYLSHPIFVIAMVCVGLCLFILAITSLGIGPQKLTCSIY